MDFYFVLCLKLQISKKLGSSVPFIISTSSGIVGRDALTDEIKEVCGCVFRVCRVFVRYNVESLILY